MSPAPACAGIWQPTAQDLPDNSISTIEDLWRRQWQPTPVLLPGKSHGRRSLVGCNSWGREESDMTEQLHFHVLEKEMATHSSVLAWRIPGMEEPGGLPSMGSHRFGHDWSYLAVAAALRTSSTRRVGMMTPASLDPYSPGQGPQLSHPWSLSTW